MCDRAISKGYVTVTLRTCNDPRLFPAALGHLSLYVNLLQFHAMKYYKSKKVASQLNPNPFTLHIVQRMELYSDDDEYGFDNRTDWSFTLIKIPII